MCLSISWMRIPMFCFSLARLFPMILSCTEAISTKMTNSGFAPAWSRLRWWVSSNMSAHALACLNRNDWSHREFHSSSAVSKCESVYARLSYQISSKSWVKRMYAGSEGLWCINYRIAHQSWLCAHGALRYKIGLYCTRREAARDVLKFVTEVNAFPLTYYTEVEMIKISGTSVYSPNGIKDEGKLQESL